MSIYTLIKESLEIYKQSLMIYKKNQSISIRLKK